ncbi:hypothetical protein [Cryptosporangium arvum]|uniref:Uncharacterized protein n=1 Tax=Cryptosporangium arvum DSM 44712 TaxID=927661 RepID=A0A010YXT6_9ACTN|nr:hypothetical protein [Cryptosporangium arvum]EXG80018.1 hypothetical protein CryarDRAFT_1077 [Cryptosporangium arvum DSM 44712]
MTRTATASTALLDQVDAAAADARRLWAEHFVPQLDQTSPVPSTSLGLQRVHAAFIAAVGGLRTGTTRCCPHVDLSAPRPMVWVAWRPRVIQCGHPECMLALDVAATGQDDYVCDGCSRYAPSTLTAVSWTSGVFLLGADLCRRCRTTPGAVA